MSEDGLSIVSTTLLQPSKTLTCVEIVCQDVKITLANGIEQPVGTLYQRNPCA